MKREIGKWFLDIAKYIVTAVILKELFGGFDEKIHYRNYWHFNGSLCFHYRYCNS